MATTSLSSDAVRRALARLASDRAPEAHGASAMGRQPVHTVYGGAHLFRFDTAKKLGATALRTVDEFLPDEGALRAVFGLGDSTPPLRERVVEKLLREPVEDLRIDFEDGYGIRPPSEEDEHAVGAAREVAKGMAAGTLPPFLGIRIKALDAEFEARAIRTLDVFMTEIVDRGSGALPRGFVVTLPKITAASQVAALAELLDEIEAKLGIERGSIGIEIMIETPQSIVGPSGKIALTGLANAAEGRCRAAHFGAYDYTASCEITAANQTLTHPACDFARHLMQVAYAGTGVWVVDGATTVLPVARHRAAAGVSLSDAQRDENRTVVGRAMRLHYDNIRHAVRSGFYQGWDLHPAQLPARYAAMYAAFYDGLDACAGRLRNFVDQAARATRVGEVFDDAATGQGLLNVFLRGISSGAVTEEEASRLTSLSAEELRERSFARILNGRRHTKPELG